MHCAIKLTAAFVCLLGLVMAGPRVPLKNLMQFLEHEHELSRQDPRRSLVCFDCHLPLLTVVAEEFEATYAACLETAAAAKSRVNNATEPDRLQVANSMHSSCELYANCNGLTDPIEYFECYANADSENTKTMYDVSANATHMLTSLREQYRLIELDEHRCTNNSERAYIKKTASTYDQLQKCLKEASENPSEDAPPTSLPHPQASTPLVAVKTENVAVVPHEHVIQ